MLLVMSGNIVIVEIVNDENCINGHKKLDSYKSSSNNVNVYEGNF